MWLLFGVCVSLTSALCAALKATGHNAQELIDTFFSLADTLTLVDNVRRSGAPPADPKKEEKVKSLWQKVRLQLQPWASPLVEDDAKYEAGLVLSILCLCEGCLEPFHCITVAHVVGERAACSSSEPALRCFSCSSRALPLVS